MSLCDVCFELVPQNELPDHMSQCRDLQILAFENLQTPYSENLLCDICYEEFNIVELEEHKIQCNENQLKLFNNLLPKVDLTKHQKAALEYSNNKAKEYSNRDYPILLDKFKKKNLDEEDLELVINYIKHIAPIIIHLNLNNILKFLCDDIYYRNQFQISASGGYLSYDGRFDWESKMFGKAYDNADGFYRVKYGPLNFTNDENGVQGAMGYGPSYILLNNDIKHRTTMTFGDSGGGTKEIATFNYFNHILNQLSDKLLDQLIKLSQGEEASYVSNYGFYIECQYHGDILFERDMETLYINKSDKITKELVNKFKTRHKCNVVYL